MEIENKPRNHTSSDHHVHFDVSSEQSEKNNEITLNKIDDNTIEVHLGFLRIKHKYLISFHISRDMLKIERRSELLPFDDKTPYISCSINNIFENVDDLVNFEIQYHTHKNRLNDEVVRFQVAGSERVISLILKSRVLGKLKGTPLLKNGIHCTGVLDLEDDSESSD